MLSEIRRNSSLSGNIMSKRGLRKKNSARKKQRAKCWNKKKKTKKCPYQRSNNSKFTFYSQLNLYAKINVMGFDGVSA